MSTASVTLIYVPYDSGKAGERCGKAPLRARAAGISERLRAHATVAEHVVTASGSYTTEGATAFDLARSISRAVADARRAGSFPLVLAGDCVSSLGAWSGMGGERPAVLWLDAHGDYNTADTSETGFLGGMPVAMLTGDTFKAATALVPGYRPLAKERLIFLGVRDLDPCEAERIAEDRIPAYSAIALRTQRADMLTAVDRIGTASDAVYLHLDMDVLDPEPVAYSDYAVPDGIRSDEIGPLLDDLAARCSLQAATITAFDPALDRGGLTMERYVALIVQVARLGRR